MHENDHDQSCSIKQQILQIPIFYETYDYSCWFINSTSFEVCKIDEKFS